jgi:hypothetical protein
MKLKALLVAITFTLGVSRVDASTINALGFYVGGSVGRASARQGIAAEAEPQYDFSEHATGWSVVAGLRPISLIGAEIEYLDFGHPSAAAGIGVFTLYSDVRQRATAISGLLYIPNPLPFFDVYARAGLARLQSSGSPSLVCTGHVCPFYPLFIGPGLSFDQWSTDFLYGAGLQAKVSALAVRVEYQRINHNGGDPDLLSVGVTWRF